MSRKVGSTLDDWLKSYKMKEEVRCLNHYFIPDYIPNLPGHGDCKVCIPDPDNNPRCIGFKPIYLINIRRFEVCLPKQDTIVMERE